MIATVNGHIRVVEMLLAHGADVNYMNAVSYLVDVILYIVNCLKWSNYSCQLIHKNFPNLQYRKLIICIYGYVAIYGIK